MGCAWYAVGAVPRAQPDARWNRGRDSPLETWVNVHVNERDDAADRYIASMYWTLSTLTTVGYGDLNAGTTVERLFAVVAMAVGVSYYTYIVSSLSSIISSFDSQAAKTHEKLDAVRFFFRSRLAPDFAAF